MLSTKLKEAAGNSADATLYVDDVFSTYLYTGNGSTQNITNGIDLAGKGGLVWTKERSNVGFSHQLIDSARGISNVIISNNNSQQAFTTAISSFDSTGYTLSSTASVNYSGSTFVGWTFRKAAKFFDVVTYTGTGSARTIAHNLGVAPGMVIVKRTDTQSDWQVYHRSLTSAAYSLILSENFAQASAPTVWNSTAPTSSVFSVGTDATVNASGGTYVAYLYANQAGGFGALGTDSVIGCGSFYVSGITGAASVNLGWEPQYLIIKRIDGLSNWYLADTMRGMPSGSNSQALYANSASAEGAGNTYSPTATGFDIPNGALVSGATYIYMAIRMPNKPPTTGTQVFMPTSTTSSTITPTSAGFPVDLLLESLTSNSSSKVAVDRLRGGDLFLWTNLTNAEQNQSPSGSSFDNNTSVLWKYTASGYPLIFWNFKRAPGFFDEVCYTGTGVATTQAHNLGVVPEMIIVKARSAATEGEVYVAPLGNDMALNLFYPNNGAAFTTGGIAWNYTTPTSSVFSLGTWNKLNGSGVTFVAYLFATLAGISKVGSYTGNGTGQAIACGFSAGARFVLIKRTDNASGWYTFDSARGLTSGSSPYLLLNSTAAEVTGNNGVYASTGGFTLGATASTTTNINAATYIFLAVA